MYRLNNSLPVCGTEFVLCLDASDALLKERVMNLPEKLVQEHNYEHEHFLRRLARYRENNVEDETVVNYFDELNMTPLYLGKPLIMKTCCEEVIKLGLRWCFLKR